MPWTARYLSTSPDDIVRHILLCQIAVSIVTCLLTIIAIHPSQYRVASAGVSTVRRPSAVLSVEPCTIITASNSASVLKSFFSSLAMDREHRPDIVAYTGNSSVRDDLAFLITGRDQLVVAQEKEEERPQAVEAKKQYMDHPYRLIYQHAISRSVPGIVVWMDPALSVVSAYLLHHLPSNVRHHDGIWSVCPSETVCTIIGIDTRNQTILRTALARMGDG